MFTGVYQALEFIEKHNITALPDFPKLHDICIKERLFTKFFSFSRIKAIYHHTADQIELLGLKEGLQEPELKHILACTFGHRLLSRSLAQSTYAKVLGFSECYFDVEAEYFASLLLVPPHALSGVRRHITTGEISQLAGIPESLAEKRVDIYRQHSI